MVDFSIVYRYFPLNNFHFNVARLDKYKGMLRALVNFLMILCVVFTSCTTVPTEKISQAELVLRGFDVITKDDPYECVGELLSSKYVFVGSAVLIRSDCVLTAAHCVVGTDISFFRTSDGHTYSIRKQTIHPNYLLHDYDLAVLKLGEPCEKTCAVLTDKFEDLQHREQLIAVGYGLHIKKVSKKDTFFYYGILLQQITVIKMLTPKGTIWFGDSGGAIFEEGGKLVGIITSLGTYKGSVVDNGATNLFMFNEWLTETINEE